MSHQTLRALISWNCVGRAMHPWCLCSPDLGCHTWHFRLDMLCAEEDDPRVRPHKRNDGVLPL
jgi:hypothetical protein